VREPVVLVEDDRLKRLTLTRELADAGYDATACQNAFEALQALAERDYSIVVTDLRMPGMDGIALLKEIKRSWPNVGVIVVTAYGTVDSAVEAIREGAFDYVLKPFSFEELAVKLRHLAERGKMLREIAELRSTVVERYELGSIVASSKAMRETIERARVVARTDSPVLIQGETGTGKELFARAIHLHSGRPDRPFVPFNCAAFNEQILESELFGHEAGAFTGATRMRRGRFESAEDGTVFLDDIDDFPSQLQVKLLRVLQERRFERVGGDTPVEVRARLVCSTKRDLREMVSKGLFRDDLLYRIDVFRLALPPLRARASEIPLLFAHLCRKHGGSAIRLEPEALRILVSYDWPGNVRELENAVQHALAFATDGVIGPGCLPEYLSSRASAERPWRLALAGRDRIDLPALVAEIEAEAVRWAMVCAGGNESRASEILNLPRTTLRRRLAPSADDSTQDDPKK
jgi:DNA-binding NtrC family response regulator